MSNNSFDVIRFRNLMKKYAKQGSEEIETSQVVDLLKEFDKKRFGTITLKDIQSQIDVDKFGSVCFASVENYANQHSTNDYSTIVPDIISIFYNNYSSDKGKRFDNKSDRLIDENDMIKLIIQMSDSSLSTEDASRMIKELQLQSNQCSIKKLSEKLIK